MIHKNFATAIFSSSLSRQLFWMGQQKLFPVFYTFFMLLPPIVTLGECTSTKLFMFDMPGSVCVKNILFSLKQV